MAASGKRKKKAQAHPPVFTLRRLVVAGLATVVFAAALIFNTEALIALPFACAAGACGHTAQWVVRGLGALALLGVAVAVIRRWRSAGAVRRRPGPARRGRRKTARKPAAARPSSGPG